MVDFQTTVSKVGRKVDTRWRAGKHGQDSARPGQLDASAFTEGTHYVTTGADAYWIPSGTAVARLASGLYGPFSSTAGAGGDVRRIHAGFVNDDEGVYIGPTPSAAKPTFARLVHGIVKKSRLPIQAQATTLAAAEGVTGSFIYVED